jgi:hypothetical protein
MVDLPYFPRPQLLESVLKVLMSGLKQGVTLFAPRRQGKTTFVKNELIPAGQEAGWNVVYLDLWIRRDDPELALVEGLEAAAKGSSSPLNMPIRLTKITGKVKPPGAELGAEFEPKPAGSEPDKVLENRLANAVAALVARAAVTMLVLDEFQALANAKSDNFVAAFRTVLQQYQGRLVVFYTGSSRDALTNMFKRQRAPLFESAFPIVLPDLQRDFVEDRAAFLDDRTSIQVDIDALEKVFIRMGRSPEFLNDIILRLMIAGSPDLDQAFGEWLKAKREELAHKVKDLNAQDVAVLQFLALPERPRMYTADARQQIATSMSTRDPITAAKLQTSIRRLTRNQLIVPTGEQGEYEIEDRGLLIVIREAPGQE